MGVEFGATSEPAELRLLRVGGHGGGAPRRAGWGQPLPPPSRRGLGPASCRQRHRRPVLTCLSPPPPRTKGGGRKGPERTNAPNAHPRIASRESAELVAPRGAKAGLFSN
eukprot:3106536-Pyramimonas_sp.AAC.1